jgi:DNA-binding NarL/FixJ family response regulator
MILVIDDHALFREGLCLLLKRLNRPLPALEASSIEAALRFTDQADDIGLILMDIYLPDSEELQGLRRVRSAYPSSPLVLISASHDAMRIDDALRLGAQGFIHKSTTADHMLQGLEQVLDGEDCYIFPGETRLPTSSLTGKLTSRQTEVLAQLCQGKSNREIGQALGLSENTIRVHLADIFRALGVSSRAEAIVMARREWLRDRRTAYRQS